MRLPLLLLLALTLGVTGCVPRKEADPNTASRPDAAHTSRNALDWAGVYEGALPCPDCAGTTTRLTLRRDETFELATTPVNAPSRVVRGRFTWQADGNAITLDAAGGGQQFVVGEGRVALLEAGAAPGWPQPAQRTLKLVPPVPVPSLHSTLESHRWTLASATDAKGRPIAGLPGAKDRPVVFSFADGRLNIEGGCNRSFGGYQIDGEGRLVVGRMASTMMACEPALMKVDATLADLLAQPAKIEIAPGAEPTLRLLAASGATLGFGGKLTLEARYGAPARVFLEVAAQTVACNNPVNGATTCLQVRERSFDANGLPQPVAAGWQPFYDPIEGYTHQPGVRNVLRLKRYTRDNTDGSQTFFWVLDLVVESEKLAR